MKVMLIEVMLKNSSSSLSTCLLSHHELNMGMFTCQFLTGLCILPIEVMVKPTPGDPADEEEYGEGAGKDGRNGVDREDMTIEGAFFTHPGILAGKSTRALSHSVIRLSATLHHHDTRFTS